MSQSTRLILARCYHLLHLANCVLRPLYSVSFLDNHPRTPYLYTTISIRQHNRSPPCAVRLDGQAPTIPRYQMSSRSKRHRKTRSFPCWITTWRIRGPSTQRMISMLELSRLLLTFLWAQSRSLPPEHRLNLTHFCSDRLNPQFSSQWMGRAYDSPCRFRPRIILKSNPPIIEQETWINHELNIVHHTEGGSDSIQSRFELYLRQATHTTSNVNPNT